MDEEPSRRAGGRGVAPKWDRSPPRPETRRKVLEALGYRVNQLARHQFSIPIPEQFCIAGFDDIAQASWISYQLTTFA